MSLAHDVKADSKEECWILLANTLALGNTDIATGLHQWNKWLMAMDRSWVYEDYKRMLQIQAHVTPTKRFVLKCPSHLWNLEFILKIFPDACVVWSHRNPVNSIASFCSLMGLGRRIFFGHIDAELVGEMMEARFLSGVQEIMEFRQRVGDERFYDINFETLIEDIPRAVMDIKKHFDLPHGKQADREVREYLQRPRGDKPGKHIYGPEQFGLDRDAIIDRFGDYIERFGIYVK
ncbi:MAG: sulfotransferase [Candidatus Thermoplasmatota archaeon]|nr:sulfotransferase [Candidatus Thermoplasmatota archaeon]MDP7266473.1 sulfotransferase [Candidatus Thermoplasmatota archaeon]